MYAYSIQKKNNGSTSPSPNQPWSQNPSTRSILSDPDPFPFFAPNSLGFVSMYLDRFLRGWGRDLYQEGEPGVGEGSIGFFSKLEMIH